MAVGWSDISKLTTSATTSNGTSDERMTDEKTGRSKVGFNASEFCAQCFLHNCWSGALCSVQGSPATILIVGCGNTSKIRQPAMATLIWMNSSANKSHHDIFIFDDADNRQHVDELLMNSTITLFHWTVKSLNVDCLKNAPVQIISCFYERCLAAYIIDFGCNAIFQAPL